MNVIYWEITNIVNIDLLKENVLVIQNYMNLIGTYKFNVALQMAFIFQNQIFFPDLRVLHIYAARCGAAQFLLHAKQANFLYFAHLGDFSLRFSVN